jgi:hypothetical protein
VAEPILVSIAAALAAKSIGSLYDLVKGKFAKRAEARAALEAAQGATPDSTEVAALAEHLADAAGEDPAFDQRLRETWQATVVEQRADRGGTTNQITGDVHGRVVQARDMHGDVTF